MGAATRGRCVGLGCNAPLTSTATWVNDLLGKSVISFKECDRLAALNLLVVTKLLYPSVKEKREFLDVRCPRCRDPVRIRTGFHGDWLFPQITGGTLLNHDREDGARCFFTYGEVTRNPSLCPLWESK